MLKLDKYSFGIGDRFGRQAPFQLRSFQQLQSHGISVTPVWNKSNREHSLIGSEPPQVLQSARDAVLEAGWSGKWHIDADHIRQTTVDRFLEVSDFFTIDVAESIGKPAGIESIDSFVRRHTEFENGIDVPGISVPIQISPEGVRAIAREYLSAVQEAGRTFRYIAERKELGSFIVEVSMDETEEPQTPAQLLVILAALADEGVPVQTIAPKFSGRFNKGIDFVGNLDQFDTEFRDDLAVIAFAVEQFGLPDNLKLSVHSGSDKFSLYPIIREGLRDSGKGIHLKTAGTTWLEELIGLCEAGDDGADFVKAIYRDAFSHRDDLCLPYANVLDIDIARLPTPNDFEGWPSHRLARIIRHDPVCEEYNPHVRQLLHVAFKLAAKRADRFAQLSTAHREIIGSQVTTNLFDRHLKPLFLG